MWNPALWLFWALACDLVDATSNESNVTRITVVQWKFKEYSVQITVILFLLIMILIKLFLSRIPYVVQYIPESLILIVIGIIFGSVVRYGVNEGSFERSVWTLTPDLFFHYLLPPIILESSYLLYNRKFSENLGTVLLFAVFGTILNFLLVGFAMFAMLKAGALRGLEGKIDLNGMLLFSSLIVAVDPVAVLAIFQDIGVERSLYYIVFGESLLNDAITVVLYKIMSVFAARDVFTSGEIILGAVSFLTVSLGGLLIGVSMGIFSCLLCRVKTHLGPFILVLLAYFAYTMSETVGWSGIIAMIGCGLLQAAYAFHNLDEHSVVLVHKLTKLVAEISESVIFLFLGIEFFVDVLEWHTGFILSALLICLVTRAITVFGLSALVNMVRVDDSRISLPNQLVIIYGGLRGAVAFSLAVLVRPEGLGIHGNYIRRLMTTATLFIILFTVGVMGVTMKPLVKLLKIRMQKERKLSLFSVLSNEILDETLSGIETLTGSTGRNVLRGFCKRIDEKYFRRILQRDPELYDTRIMLVYEEIALKVHQAITRPEKMADFLHPLPETLRKKSMIQVLSSNSLRGLTHMPSSHVDLERGMHVARMDSISSYPNGHTTLDASDKSAASFTIQKHQLHENNIQSIARIDSTYRPRFSRHPSTRDRVENVMEEGSDEEGQIVIRNLAPHTISPSGSKEANSDAESQ